MKLLAVSGGIDSMCMAEMAYGRGDEFAVAHCNFALRGSDSDADEQFVRNWCKERSIKFHSVRFDTSGFAEGRGVSIEMAARDLRYGWFAELCSEFGYEAVCVAHNSNDNAETLMLNLLRGTGSRGLRGMAASHSYDSGEAVVKVERPLLAMSRQEIRDWMIANGCSWREDGSNASGEYKRNRIRNEVFPVFAGINPSFVRTLNSDMERFSQVDDIAEEYFRNCGLSLEQGVSVPQLLGFKHWEYLLFRLCEPYGLNSDVLESLQRAITSGEPLSGKRFGPLVTTSDRIIVDRGGLRRQDVGCQCIREGDSCMVVEGPGTYEFKGRRVSINVVPAQGMARKQAAGTLVADAACLSFPFLLRGWMSGDWLRPLGMRGSKKLSDLFVDLKWSLVDKSEAVVAVSPELNSDGSGHVAALLCVRIDESIKITAATTHVVVIKYL